MRNMLSTYLIYSNNSIKQSEALKIIEKVTFMPISAQNPYMCGFGEQFTPTAVENETIN